MESIRAIETNGRTRALPRISEVTRSVALLIRSKHRVLLVISAFY